MAFCGDTQFAYPLFVQVATSINNHFKNRSGATDFRHLTHHVELILNGLYSSWDLREAEKRDALRATRIYFGGWSWQKSVFIHGFYILEEGGGFNFHKRVSGTQYPFKEKYRSLIFMGDYESEYRSILTEVLLRKYPSPPREGRVIDLDYESLEALSLLLCQDRPELAAIGGAPQMLKVYPFGSDLPMSYMDRSGIYLFGRRLMPWEKTSFPIFSLTSDGTNIEYPMTHIGSAESILENYVKTHRQNQKA